jgi:tRNA nucleotidyltransferase/poly(A) polymerase
LGNNGIAMLSVTKQFDAALRIVGELRAAGYEAYLAGGCVRDLLLGREPKDYDVATSATPDVVLRMFPRSFAVGARFGVVLVAARDTADDFGGAAEGKSATQRAVTEVATFRSVYGQRRGGCAAAGFHHQWAVAGPGKDLPSGAEARFFGGAECTG